MRRALAGNDKRIVKRSIEILQRLINEFEQSPIKAPGLLL